MQNMEKRVDIYAVLFAFILHFNVRTISGLIFMNIVNGVWYGGEQGIIGEV